MKPQTSSLDLFGLIPDYDLLKYSTKEFFNSVAHECVDEAIAWLEESHDGQRVAILRASSSERSFVMMPIALYERLDDLKNAESFLPHWELDSILTEDLPVVRDVLVAANDELLFTCVRELLDDALYPNERPDIAGACDYIQRMTDIVRGFEYDASSSIVMLPRCRYRVGAKGVTREMQTISLTFDNAREGNVTRECVDRIKWWHYTLGRKAWFGGVSIRDEYRALAWLLCSMHVDGLVDYGVWMGGRPERDYAHPSVRELNKNADEDLRQRVRDFADRLCEPDDLTTMSFECSKQDYDLLAEACQQRGLSVQNAIHIALRRLIAYCGNACGTPGKQQATGSL